MSVALPPPVGELVFAPAENPTRVRRALAALVGVSLLGHALGFYALQAFHTPAGALPPASPPARWTLVPAGSPEAAALGRWLAVVDPALGAGAAPLRPGNVLAGLPPVPYRPSFQTRSPLAGLGDLGADTLTTRPAGSVFPPGPVLPARDAPPRVARPGAVSARSRVTLPDALRRRLPPGDVPPLPDLNLAVAGLAALPRPTAFLVGARPEGGQPLVFRENSSGVAAADEAARVYLETLPFTPDAHAAAAWGRVTVFWGREAFR